MENIGDLIREYRQSHGLSMEEFGKRAGLSKAYISLIERGKNTRSNKPIVPSIDTMKAIADGLEMDLDVLLRSIDPSQKIKINSTRPKGVQIPVLGRVVAGVPLEAVEEILDYEEITPELAATGEFFALQIRGRSMEPRMLEGDVVIVRRQSDVDSGDIAIVLVNGDEATVKRVSKSDRGITLIATNPNVYEPHFYSSEEINDLPVQILGKVVELRGKL